MSAGKYREGDAQRHILLEEVVPGSGEWTPVSTPGGGGGGGGGALTDTQLRATPVAVTVSGVATAGNQTTGNAILTAIGTLLSNPLVVTGTFYQATQPISAASLPLPSGASTSALQTSGNASLTTIAASTAVPTTIPTGRKSVTTAGTRVALATTTPCKSVTIKAFDTNSGVIYVGDVTVSSANGYELYAGESISFDVADVSTVNIDSSLTASEGVTFLAVN